MEWHVVCSSPRSVADERHFPSAYRHREVFIVEIQKKYVEVQAIKKKGNQEEIENKIKAVHRRLTRTYPVYYDWWLQDGTTGDVDWFSKSFNQETFRAFADPSKQYDRPPIASCIIILLTLLSFVTI